MIRLVYNWQVLAKLILSGVLLSKVLDVPGRKSINDRLLD